MQGFATFADVYGSGNGPTYDQSTVVGPDNADATTGQKVTGGGGGAGIMPVDLFSGLRGITPFAGAVVLVSVLLLVHFLREWKAEEGQLPRDVKVGAHNLIVVTLLAIAGIPLVKGLLAKYHVPGLTEWVLNA